MRIYLHSHRCGCGAGITDHLELSILKILARMWSYKTKVSHLIFNSPIVYMHLVMYKALQPQKCCRKPENGPPFLLEHPQDIAFCL